MECTDDRGQLLHGHPHVMQTRQQRVYSCSVAVQVLMTVDDWHCRSPVGRLMWHAYQLWDLPVVPWVGHRSTSYRDDDIQPKWTLDAALQPRRCCWSTVPLTLWRGFTAVGGWWHCSYFLRFDQVWHGTKLSKLLWDQDQLLTRLMKLKNRWSSVKLLLISWSILPWHWQWGNRNWCYESNILVNIFNIHINSMTSVEHCSLNFITRWKARKSTNN